MDFSNQGNSPQSGGQQQQQGQQQQTYGAQYSGGNQYHPAGQGGFAQSQGEYKWCELGQSGLFQMASIGGSETVDDW